MQKKVNGLGIKDECRQCGYPLVASWSEMSEDERFIAERLASDRGETREQIKKHRFCKRCFRVFADAPSDLA